MADVNDGRTREQLIAEVESLQAEVARLTEVNGEVRARFEAFMDNSPVIAFIKDADGRLLYINERFMDAFEFHERDWYRKTDFELWAPETAEILRANDLAILASGQPVEIEEPVKLADGLHHWISFKFPFSDQSGNLYLGGTAVEITELKLLQEQLQESNSRLAAHMEFTPMLAVTWDEKLVCTEWNPTAAKVLGIAREQSLGRSLGELLLVDDDREARAECAECAEYAEYKRFLAAEEAHTTTVHATASDPEARRTIEWYHTKLLDKDGALIGMASLGRDITLVLQQQEQLRLAKEQAELLAKAKSRFLANMSHEIRTPMNGIMGASDLLQGMELDAEADVYVQLIHDSARALSGIVDDILSLSRIESGNVRLRPIHFDLDSLLGHTQMLFAAEATRRGLDLLVDASGMHRNRFTGDEGLMRQILNNLISNALKFTPAGHVSLIARSQPVTGRDGISTGVSAVELTVKDSGIGIAPARQDEIFERFTQIDSSPTRTVGGAGLGLAISRKLARIMGGQLTCESEVGVGSRFTLNLKLADRDEVGVVARERPQRDYQKSALLVEDNRINQAIARRMLGQLGLRIDLCENGQEAIDHVQRHAYDLVLMDLHMPVMGGIEATRHIRRLPRGHDLPIIALTADAMEDARRACMEVGMNGYLTKPISHETLVVELDRWFT